MARICLISEGSYPYVVGGVSSWVHDIINENTEYEFILLCIIPNKDFAVNKYEIPENVVEVKNIVLNPELDIPRAKMIKNSVFRNKKLEKKLEKILCFKGSDPRANFQVMEEIVTGGYGSPSEILMSKEFWNALEDYYREKYGYTNFNTFYWTHRNIFLNLFELISEELPKADIYHTVATGYAGFVASIAKQKKLGKVLLTEHGMYPREREEEIINAQWIEKDFKEVWVNFFYFLSKVAYQHSDEIVSLFDYNRRLQIEYGAPEKACRVIPNGVDIERFTNIERKKRKGFSVGAVLRVVPIKDIKMMLKAIKVAKNKMRDTTFYLIGPTDENESYYKECKQLVVDLEMDSYVTFTGKVMVDEYYGFLDLLLLTSISEGQPLSILEGLATGIPFVATDVGNCREILLEKKDIGEAGIVVPPTAYSEFAAGIVNLYQNRDRLLMMGRNGEKIVKKYYPRKIFIDEYKKLYERLGENKWQA